MKIFARLWVRGLFMHLACLILVSAWGCVIIPLPEHGLSAGRGKIGEADIAFLKVGETSREDVVLRFGEPDAVLFDQRILAYLWAVSAGYGVVGTISGGGASGGPIRNHYLFMLEFDDEGRLRRAEMNSSWSLQNLQEQALKWFETLDLAVLKVPPMLVGKMISAGESALYIYRESGYAWESGYFGQPFEAGGKLPWEVRVNGNVVGWLHRGEYLAIALAPGAHRVTVYLFPGALNWQLLGASIGLRALPGQAHYVLVWQPRWNSDRYATPVLTVRSEVEALSVLKKMKPMP